MVSHVVDRGMKPMNGRAFTPFYYLPSLFFSLFPWAAFIGAAALTIRRRWDDTQAFLLSWFLAPYLVFCFYATQLPHYVLPGFPAGVLLLAQAFEGRSPAWEKGIFYGVCGIGSALAAGLFAIGFAETFPPEIRPLREFVLALAGLVAALTVLACLVRFGQWRALALPVVAIGLCLSLAASALRPLTPAVQMESVFRQLPAEAEAYFLGFEEPSLVYYADRRWLQFPLEGHQREIMEKPGPRILVLLRNERRMEEYLAAKFPALFRLKEGKPPKLDRGLYEDLPARGYRRAGFAGVNTARISWVEVEAWYRTQ
jgi:hypothetical protein